MPPNHSLVITNFMDYDALTAVAEDLEYLSQWGGEFASGEIRRGSAILRRLLVEDAYGAAWRASGEAKQPTLIAVDFAAMVGDRSNELALGLAGGALFRGVFSAGVMLRNSAEPMNRQPPAPIRENGFPYDKVFALSEYLSSPSGYVDGKSFNRREVIKYFANVKGGVHLSAKERKAEEKLIARLGKIEKKFMMRDADGLLLEIVAIGQSLGKSSDARAYIEKVANMKPF
ncbi:hypothetical protein KBK24_0119225 [Burkholderia sp. K24]|nr:hypothetical protein KBK24_0119225 [Burkholderia sp. K24]